MLRVVRLLEERKFIYIFGTTRASLEDWLRSTSTIKHDRAEIAEMSTNAHCVAKLRQQGVGHSLRMPGETISHASVMLYYWTKQPSEERVHEVSSAH